MTLFQLQTGSYTRLVYAGQGPGIIVNRDLVNSALLGNYNGFNTWQEPSILDALTFVQFSGDSDVYGTAQTATLTVDVMPDMQNWAPSPGQAAASIAAIGLATAANQVAQNTLIPSGIAGMGIPAILSSAIGSIPAQAVNTSWGPYTFTFTTGGGYQITFLPAVAGNVCASDVSITHLDVNGNTVFIDRYTICTAGGLGNLGCVIRGNLYGNRIVVSGQTAAQAFITAIFASNPTVTGFSAAPVYSRPFVEATKPKMIPLAFDGTIMNVLGTAVPANAGTTTLQVLQPYSGSAVLFTTNVTSGAALYNFVSSYSVGNGTGRLYLSPIITVLGTSVGEAVLINLDQRMHQLQYQNNAATATTIGAQIVAGDYI